MPILRKQKVRKYTTVDNYFIDDINLPPEGKGYLLYMLRKPDNWNFTFKNIQEGLNVGERNVRTNIQRLEDLKYIKRERIRNDKGYYQWIYYIYEIPYGKSCMHEFVASADRQKNIGVTAIDICKRMLDYGFHAPTVYFPLIVHEALMIEPTETESKQTLDEFTDTLIGIFGESKNNPEVVHNAPVNTSVKRLNEVEAARKPKLHW